MGPLVGNGPKLLGHPLDPGRFATNGPVECVNRAGASRTQLLQKIYASWAVQVLATADTGKSYYAKLSRKQVRTPQVHGGRDVQTTYKI